MPARLCGVKQGPRLTDLEAPLEGVEIQKDWQPESGGGDGEQKTRSAE